MIFLCQKLNTALIIIHVNNLRGFLENHHAKHPIFYICKADDKFFYNCTHGRPISHIFFLYVLYLYIICNFKIKVKKIEQKIGREVLMLIKFNLNKSDGPDSSVHVHIQERN